MKYFPLWLFLAASAAFAASAENNIDEELEELCQDINFSLGPNAIKIDPNELDDTQKMAIRDALKIVSEFFSLKDAQDDEKEILKVETSLGLFTATFGVICFFYDYVYCNDMLLKIGVAAMALNTIGSFLRSCAKLQDTDQTSQKFIESKKLLNVDELSNQQLQKCQEAPGEVSRCIKSALAIMCSKPQPEGVLIGQATYDEVIEYSDFSWRQRIIRALWGQP